jgi:dihydroxy-acid dehydratase
MAILGELDRLGLIDASVPRVDAASLAEVIATHDIMSPSCSDAAKALYRCAPEAREEILSWVRRTIPLNSIPTA